MVRCHRAPASDSVLVSNISESKQTKYVFEVTGVQSISSKMIPFTLILKSCSTTHTSTNQQLYQHRPWCVNGHPQRRLCSCSNSNNYTNVSSVTSALRLALSIQACGHTLSPSHLIPLSVPLSPCSHSDGEIVARSG